MVLLFFCLKWPMVHALEKSKLEGLKIVIAGIFLLAVSFLVLNISNWIGIAIIGMLFMSFGEMLGFPFSNAYALNRSKRGKPGDYMALYSIAFSFAHIFGHNAGMQMVNKIGFDNTWYIITLLAALCVFLLFILKQFMKAKKIKQ